MQKNLRYTSNMIPVDSNITFTKVTKFSDKNADFIIELENGLEVTQNILA